MSVGNAAACAVDVLLREQGPDSRGRGDHPGHQYQDDGDQGDREPRAQKPTPDAENYYLTNKGVAGRNGNPALE